MGAAEGRKKWSKSARGSVRRSRSELCWDATRKEKIDNWTVGEAGAGWSSESWKAD